ncbi:hypothetical protein L210DRAFT_3741321 [Boletus edulis BED1]|uniref:Uncharacterized protein n=1 Tax=Boletus edulis BED1 TaxID=1328754 RepID=A0AAD4BG27_BOLED|nr:hypothetical protein L210DRAFT_3741321 [Boletus edulis BED1]
MNFSELGLAVQEWGQAYDPWDGAASEIPTYWNSAGARHLTASVPLELGATYYGESGYVFNILWQDSGTTTGCAQPAFAVASPSPRGVLRFPCTSSRSLQAGPRFRNFSHQNFTNTYMSHRSTETDPDARTYKYLRQRAVDAQLFVRIRDAPHSVVESSNQEIKEAAMYCRQAGGCTEQAQMAVSDCLVSLMTLMGKDQSGHLVDAVRTHRQRLWGTDEHFKSAEMVLGHEGVVIVQKAGAEVDTFKDAFTYNQDPVPGAQREETRAQQTFAMPRVASVCHPDLGK